MGVRRRRHLVQLYDCHKTTKMRAIVFATLALTAISFSYGHEGQEIAFSVGLSHHEYLDANKKVIYDTIFTNVGSAYDTNTGIFNCPVAGLYVFQFHALSHSNSNMWLELYHNYSYVASIWGHVDNDYSAAGNSVILRLAKGDQVYVATADKTDLYGQPYEVYGTFSGYLISAIYEELPVVG